jgi:hypothetical protein
MSSDEAPAKRRPGRPRKDEIRPPKILAPKKLPKGRPPFVVKQDVRTRVIQMSASGMTHDQIAAAVGCSAPTLRKRFAHELETGPARLRDEAIAMLCQSARNGNVGAQKIVFEIAQREAAARAVENAHAEFVGPAPETAAAPAKVGKKEQRVIDAEQAGIGTDWGDDLHMGVPN